MTDSVFDAAASLFVERGFSRTQMHDVAGRHARSPPPARSAHDDPMPAWMDPGIYRIPTIAHTVAMLRTAGFESIVHHGGDEPTHWFVAEVPPR